MTEQTIAELYELDHNDPWQTKSIQPVAPWNLTPPEPPEPSPFCDPADDESTEIGDRSQRFWRITVVGQRLGQLVALAPTLVKVAFSMRNNSTGCWVACTSHRVAQRLVQHFREHAMQVSLIACNEHGNAIDTSKVQTTERILYCIGDYTTEVRAVVVPEAFWNRYHRTDCEQPVVLPSMFRSTARPDCFVTHCSLMVAKRALDAAGFIEHPLLQAHVNEFGR